jgi:hypothetical protein
METGESMKVGDYVRAEFSPNLIMLGQIIEELCADTGERNGTTYNVRLFSVRTRDYVMFEKELTVLTYEEAMLWKLENL